MEEISAKKVVIISFIVDAVDIITNLVVAFITGSTIIMAETLQGVADLTAVSFLLVGLMRSRRPADQKHPFGYGKELYFWTLLASILMFAGTASLSFYLGFERFLSPQPIPNIFVAYLVLILAVITNGYAFSLNLKRLTHNASKRLIIKHFIQSPHIETKTTFVLDLMGLSAACLGLVSLVFFNVTGNLRFDGVGAMMIGVVLATLSFVLILGVKELLIGITASRKIKSKIREVALSFDQVREVGTLKTIYIGSSKLLVNLDLHFKNDLETDQIEQLTLKIKEEIRKKVPVVDDVQIELTA